MSRAGLGLGLGLCWRTPAGTERGHRARGGRERYTEGAVRKRGRPAWGQGARSDAGPTGFALRFPAGGLEERVVFLFGRSPSAAERRAQPVPARGLPRGPPGTTEASPLAREASTGPCGGRRLLRGAGVLRAGGGAAGAVWEADRRPGQPGREASGPGCPGLGGRAGAQAGRDLFVLLALGYNPLVKLVGASDPLSRKLVERSIS